MSERKERRKQQKERERGETKTTRVTENESAPLTSKQRTEEEEPALNRKAEDKRMAGRERTHHTNRVQ